MLEKRLKVIGQEMDAISSVLVLHMAAQGIHKLSTKQGTFYIRADVFASVKDEEAFKDWCDGEVAVPATEVTPAVTIRRVLYRETVNAQTLGKFVRDRLDSDKEVPRSLGVFYETKIAKRASR